DILHAELLPFKNGYSARLMRPISIGHSTVHSKVAQKLIEIQDKQFDAMAPGEKACDIDAIAREGVLSSGLRDEYPNITGYTLGYYPLSTPRTSDFTRVFLPTSSWKLESGMVFHMYVSARG